MSPSSVAILGGNRLAEDLHRLAREKGLNAARCAGPDEVDPATEIIVDTLAHGSDEKRRLVEAIDDAAPGAALVLSSCTRWSTTTLASWSRRPERIAGFATFHPLARRNVIELARGLDTGDEAMAAAGALVERLGKGSAVVKDAPGLVFPRILSLIINEAARSLDEGVATAEEIDVALRLGTNYPQGPLRWADEIGLDEVLAVLDGLLEETGDDRYRPAPLLRKMVASGRLGESAGRGFYRHGETGV